MGLLYLRNVTTLRLDRAACAGCGDCVEVCPREVLALEDGTAVVREPDACIECGACALNCPTGALTVRAGVGCASGIISGMLGREGDCCCVPTEDGSTPDPRVRADPAEQQACQPLGMARFRSRRTGRKRSGRAG